MIYKHTNKGKGTICISDSKGVWYTLKPGTSCDLDKKHEGYDLVIEESKPEQKKINIKDKEVD